MRKPEYQAFLGEKGKDEGLILRLEVSVKKLLVVFSGQGAMRGNCIRRLFTIYEKVSGKCIWKVNGTHLYGSLRFQSENFREQPRVDHFIFSCHA